MRYFRITKYDPKLRENGLYACEEWTSISDIGKIYNGHKVTAEEYYHVENTYVQCYMDILEKAELKVCQIVGLECYEDVCWKNKQRLDTAAVRDFIIDCLREKCWGKLIARDHFIHFGYDYYTYLGTALMESEVRAITQRYGLYAEAFVSPYLDSKDPGYREYHR